MANQAPFIMSNNYLGPNHTLSVNIDYNTAEPTLELTKAAPLQWTLGGTQDGNRSIETTYLGKPYCLGISATDSSHTLPVLRVCNTNKTPDETWKLTADETEFRTLQNGLTGPGWYMAIYTNTNRPIMLKTTANTTEWLLSPVNGDATSTSSSLPQQQSQASALASTTGTTQASSNAANVLGASNPAGLSTGAKIGIGLGVGLGVPLLALAVCLFVFFSRRRRRQEALDRAPALIEKFDHASSAPAVQELLSRSPSAELPSKQTVWELPSRESPVELPSSNV